MRVLRRVEYCLAYSDVESAAPASLSGCSHCPMFAACITGSHKHFLPLQRPIKITALTVKSLERPGMIWSGFRPSDDAQVYGYNTAVNMYVFGAVVRAMKLNDVYWRQARFTELARDLCRTIRCRRPQALT